MSFHNVEEVEQALRTPRLAVRALHEIWDRRLPIPEPAPHKTAKPGGDGRLIAWVQEDLRLASHFCRQCFEGQDFQLVCDAAREILRYWEQDGKTGSPEFANIRTDFAAALARLGYLQEARRELETCLQSARGSGRKANIFRLLGEVEREEAHRASDRAMAVQAIEKALHFYRQAHEIEPDSLEASAWMAAGTIYVATKGLDIRFVVTSIETGSAEHIYQTLYCARGQAENLIKLHKAQLASDRTSCRSPLANQMRLILHTAAYWLMLAVRDAIPKAHALATAEFNTIRLRLLKLGARVVEMASRVRLAFAAAAPDATLIRYLAAALMPAGP